MWPDVHPDVVRTAAKDAGFEEFYSFEVKRLVSTGGEYPYLLTRKVGSPPSLGIIVV
jgi:hypothetical protein